VNCALALLSSVYRLYDTERSAVIDLYVQGRSAEAKDKIQDEVQALYNQACDLCEEFLRENEQYVAGRLPERRGGAIGRSRERVRPAGSDPRRTIEHPHLTPGNTS